MRFPPQDHVVSSPTFQPVISWLQKGGAESCSVACLARCATLLSTLWPFPSKQPQCWPPVPSRQVVDKLGVVFRDPYSEFTQSLSPLGLQRYVTTSDNNLHSFSHTFNLSSHLLIFDYGFVCAWWGGWVHFFFFCVMGLMGVPSSPPKKIVT